jgi:hypothetical protein
MVLAPSQINGANMKCILYCLGHVMFTAHYIYSHFTLQIQILHLHMNNLLEIEYTLFRLFITNLLGMHGSIPNLKKSAN